MPQTNDISPLRGKLFLSFNGAVTFPMTDYVTPVPAPMGIGAVEYFFNIRSKNALGIRVYGGTGTIEGSDNSKNPNSYYDNIFFFGAGLTYSFAVSRNIMPYGFFGVSNVWYNPKDNLDNAILTEKPPTENLSATAYHYEFGFKFLLSEYSTFNIGGGELITITDKLDGLGSGAHLDVVFYGTVGISIGFFGEPDSDGDGVPDAEDACPGTPKGVEVDILGCPIDSDKDGVPDYIDKCSGTPPEVIVDENGCPLDEDKDGVPDYLDICPGTPPGEKVNQRGCPEIQGRISTPDTLQKKEAEPEPEIKEPEYNFQREYLVKDMVFTDGKLFTTQVSSWQSKLKAESEARTYRRMGYDAFVVEYFIDKKNQTWFQVRVGYFKSFIEAQDVRNLLKQ